MSLPWSVVLDVSYVGRHNYNAEQTVDINALDYGTAFLATAQDPTIPVSATPGASSLASTNPDLLRAYRGYGSLNYRSYDAWRTFHSIQFNFNRRFRDGLQFGFSDSITLSDVANAAPRYDHDASGQLVLRADQAEAQELLGDQVPQTHIMKGTFVWDMPDIKSSKAGWRALGFLVNDWQLSGIWTGTSGSAYTITQSYQSGGGNVNLTGSPTFGGRIRIVGDPGEGCTSDPYRQFNTAAFQGPLVGSVGLESANNYLFGCFLSVLDISIARNIRLGGSRVLQLRLDSFNAPNQAIITGRQQSVTLASPNDPVTALNLPHLPDGTLNPARVRPNSAGFGAVNAWQTPRNLQAYIRFSF